MDLIDPCAFYEHFKGTLIFKSSSTFHLLYVAWFIKIYVLLLSMCYFQMFFSYK